MSSPVSQMLLTRLMRSRLNSSLNVARSSVKRFCELTNHVISARVFEPYGRGLSGRASGNPIRLTSSMCMCREDITITLYKRYLSFVQWREHTSLSNIGSCTFMYRRAWDRADAFMSSLPLTSRTQQDALSVTRAASESAI